jgi:hypothetical protein
MNKETVAYIIDLLTLGNVSSVFYGMIEEADSNIKIIIEQSCFWEDGIYGTEKSLPNEPLLLFRNVPILFGSPEITMSPSGQIILHADIIASAYFLLSRYEEFVKKDCRDIHGRFLGKESVIFKSGYAQRPLVDEYGELLRGLLCEVGVAILGVKNGFSKIYLTHDIDIPFKYHSFFSVIKQFIKNMIKRGDEKKCFLGVFHAYVNINDDDYYTFPKLIEYDSSFKKRICDIPVEHIYFIIAANHILNRKYYNFNSPKIQRLLQYLIEHDSILGLHVSYEGGLDPIRISKEVKKLQNFLQVNKGSVFYSRHHFLRWHEPEDVVFMEQAGITDDFTLTYADCIGFRCGTSHSYRFINPSTQMLTNVSVHPLSIMECVLNRNEYMGLDYDNAFAYCKTMIDQVYRHNGEIVLLWHNTEFTGCNYQEKLYIAILAYIASKT